MPDNILRYPLLRDVEARFQAATPPLMERAGAAAASVALEMLGHGGTPLILAGPGNNGGDAFVVARLLRNAGHKPVVVFRGDAGKLPTDARAAFDAWQRAGGTTQHEIPPQDYGLIVDGLFGIGLTRPLDGPYAKLIAHGNGLGCPILALDVPSGLDAATGRVLGSTVRATRTVSFIALKPGLLTLDGPDHCGDVSVHDLGLVYAEQDGVRVDTGLFGSALRARPRNSHKGTFGSAAIIGGAPGMAGAALLAGRAALQSGAGRVYVCMLERLPVDPLQPELMLRGADEVIPHTTALAIGPGLGQSAGAVELLRRAIAAPLPLVVDADGLNLLAAHPVLLTHLARRNPPALLTPHPAEAGRLLGRSTDAIQADRVGAALELAARCHANIVLKGCGSIIAAADGRWAINTTGNAGLATAGSGDVLTGIVVALLAQGWPAHEALAGAVHVHGAAADALVAAGCGPIGLTAAELIAAARQLLNNWVANAGN